MPTSLTSRAPAVGASAPAPAAGPTNLRHLPAPARAAFARFQEGGDPVAIYPVVFAILDDFAPTRSAIPLADLPATTRLVEDLAFDSLAITEVVFAAEDLFGISITNAEIVQVCTLGDLCGFIHAKVSDRLMR